LELERQKLKISLDENMASTFTVEIIKAQALDISEKIVAKKK